MTLASTWSSVISTWPTATPKQRTFFNWNLMVERTSVSLVFRSSACDTGVGNLPAIHIKVLCYTLAKGRMQIYLPFERPGPKRRGICLMRDSEARKASYFFASFLTSFLFLFNLESTVVWCQCTRVPKRYKCTHFFKSSADMYSRSICLARSMSAASARMQMDMRGRGTFASL